MFIFSRQKIITFLMVGYLVAIIVFLLVRNISITPDRLFILLLFAAIIVGRTKSFLKDWIPFVALILAYEMLRGFAENSFFTPHIHSLIYADQLLFFGYLPTEVLQDWFYKAGSINPIDIVSTLVYFLHFPLPFLLAFFLWLKNKAKFHKFIIALLVLSFAGFITYLLFPAAPPWFASDMGLISVTKITNLAVDHFGWTWNLSAYYESLNPNPVAAMPSLHAAYPTLVFLALRDYSKKISWFFLVYLFLIYFAIVYLGEHYVIDAIAGAFYAFGAYYLVYRSNKLKSWFMELREAAKRFLPFKKPRFRIFQMLAYLLTFAFPFARISSKGGESINGKQRKR